MHVFKIYCFVGSVSDDHSESLELSFKAEELLPKDLR